MQESPPSSWEIIERGVFAVARCHVCGWHSPARRAYSTARREGLEHGLTCPGAGSVSGPGSVSESGSMSGSDAAPEPPAPPATREPDRDTNLATG